MKKFLYSLPLTVLGFLLGAFPSLAAGNLNSALGNLGTAGKRAGTNETQVEVIVGQVIFTALSFVGLIFLVLMVYAGYLWMTARGDSGQVEKAQDIVRMAMIGLIIVVSAYAITALVTARLGAIG